MNNKFNTGYQYDRCISRGICSINPTTASLQEVIFVYLRHAAYYGIKLIEHGISNQKTINLILNTISVLSSNYEISENNFNMINCAFQAELPRIIEEFKSLDIKDKMLDTDSILKKQSLNDYIRLGEKEFNQRIKSMPADIRNLYRILFLLLKSLSVNILIYESYGEVSNKEILSVFKVLNLLNLPQKDKKELTQFIIDIAEEDCELMEKIHTLQEKNYGKQDEYKVSFSTRKGKAILVVGSNLKELEQILDKFKDKDIDIYTHDNMILAHTYPKFREYKNLVGQFGQGMENCLLDFSTFPGPIILTRNSLFNVENLYRGRLFTTDFAYSKGVIPIKNNDFSEVYESAQESSGFKTGKSCEAEIIGFSLERTLNLINDKLADKNYKNIIFIGINGYSEEENEYFKTFIKHSPSDSLIISMSCQKTKDNLISLNIGNDLHAMFLVAKEVLKQKYNVNFFLNLSDRHALSVIINLSNYLNSKIYIGKWNQAFLNPNILECLKTEFGASEISTPKKDLDNVSKVK